MTHSDSIAKLAAALSAVQGAMQPAEKNSLNPHFKKRYADLGSVWEAARALLAANGLSVAQFPDEAEPGQIALTSTLLHTSGEWMTARFTMTPSKNDPQGAGSALTYMRRYALSSILGIVSDEDDDGNASVQRGQRPAPNPKPRQFKPKSKSTVSDDAHLYGA